MLVCEDGYLSNKASEAASAYETDSCKKHEGKVTKASINMHSQNCKNVQKCAKLYRNMPNYLKIRPTYIKVKGKFSA